MDRCIFCQIVEGQIPAERVYESDHVLAILDIHPLAPGHVLVMPKTHRETLTDLSVEELTNLTTRTQEIARALVRAAEAEGFNLLSNNHRCAGQAIPHAHLHVVPRRSGDGIRFQWPTRDYAEGEAVAWAEKIRKTLAP